MSTQSLNVLLYSALPEKVQGGIATWTNTYINECNYHGINCTLVNCAAEGARANNPEAKLSIRDEIKRTIRIFRDLRNKSNMELDVAHVNTSCGPMGIIRDCIAVNLIKKKRIKVIVHFHCDIPFWVHSKIAKLCLQSLCDNSDIVFVLCHNSADFLKKNCGKSSIVIPNFVSGENVVDSRKVKETYDSVIYVGGIQPEKGCYEIFEAAEKCGNKKFLLVGELDENVNTDNISKNIELIGSLSHDKVLEELDNADVFLFPSHSEGFSLALAEAMSRGLPVIATDVGANLDMHENLGGITIQVNNPASIVEALGELESQNVRQTMATWNISKVKNNYTSDKVLEKFFEIYLSMF